MRSAVQSCVPLLENQALTKVSWVLFSCPWTPREHQIYLFHLVFIISIGACRMFWGGFLYMDFYFVRNLHSLLIQVPLKFPGYFHVWNQVADFPLFSCDFGVREHGREHRRYFLKAKRTRFQHHPIQQTHPPWEKQQKRLYVYNLFHNFLIYL